MNDFFASDKKHENASQDGSNSTNLSEECLRDNKLHRISLYVFFIILMCTCVANLFNSASDMCVAARQVDNSDVFTNIVCIPIMLFTGTKDAPKEEKGAQSELRHTKPTSLYVKERSSSRISLIGHPVRTIRTTILLLLFAGFSLAVWRVIKPTKKKKKRKKKKSQFTPQELADVKLAKSQKDNDSQQTFIIKDS